MCADGGNCTRTPKKISSRWNHDFPHQHVIERYTNRRAHLFDIEFEMPLGSSCSSTAAVANHSSD
jgi:hypothetical protein